MESGLLFYVFNGQFLACFIAEYGFVLGSVVFECSSYVFHKRDQEQICDEDYDFYTAFYDAFPKTDISRCYFYKSCKKSRQIYKQKEDNTYVLSSLT